MIGRIRSAWRRVVKSASDPGLHFDRPLVAFQSDDWGRVGVRDRDGSDELRAAGIPLGEAPYDSYTLETAVDVDALRAMLKNHRDSVGRHPSMGMNFIMANVDFDQALMQTSDEVPLVPLTVGLPGTWQRPRLFEAYRQGLQEGVFLPALHGLTHFCGNAIRRKLQDHGERARLIRTMWRAQTPYIHWRMPWIGFEYWDPELQPGRRFLSLDEQRSAITRASEIYREFFQSAPFSACAPGYRANEDTNTAWFEAGIRVVQNGSGDRKAPHFDSRGMLHTFRTIEMEPATGTCDLQILLKQVQDCFRSGLPAIVSSHSINFHSTIRDFRTPTLSLLDQFLTAVEAKWPNLLYVRDADLFQIAREGFYFANAERVAVRATGVGATERA